MTFEWRFLKFACAASFLRTAAENCVRQRPCNAVLLAFRRLNEKKALPPVHVLPVGSVCGLVRGRRLLLQLMWVGVDGAEKPFDFFISSRAADRRKRHARDGRPLLR
jgi:hypothetical protein